MDDLKIVITGDNSATLNTDKHGETYHNINGAITEAKYIYAHEALNISANHISILEVGYGTGLNAMQTFFSLKQLAALVKYTGVDINPLPAQIIEKLAYYHQFGFSKGIYKKFYQDWNQWVSVSSKFHLLKFEADICSFHPQGSYDLIYFDAFSPNVQPELWSEIIFLKMYNCLKDGGKLLTYSSRGCVKQALRSVGFQVKRVKGPPGKRHILHAIKLS
jgi:tRNA U34 5-methylaminomethyl-2-thiouridine-forming methyltransferase MnmC